MAKWYQQRGFQDDVVLSTRIRLARNISGIPFPTRMTKEDAQKTIDAVSDALSGFNYKFHGYPLGKLDKMEAQALLEEYQISPKMLEQKEGRAVFLSADNKVSIMVNEEDHIRMQCLFAGFETEKAFDLINKVDDYLSEKIDFAFHETYGYLTACLTNAGTGMRVSYMLHLPALCLSGKAAGLFSAVSKLGIAVRGLYGEGSDAAGHLFQISNQVTLGLSEQEIISKMTDVINQIITKEREMRNALLKENKLLVEDKVWRSYGLLQHARLMSTKELMETLSYVRLGIAASLIDGVSFEAVNTAMIESRPAHVIKQSGKDLTPAQRDAARAAQLRKIFS